MSLVGFDDLPEARYVTPSLTTVRQDIPAKAEAAVRTLLQLIDSKQPDPRVRLNVELAERGSIAPPIASAARLGGS